MDNFIATGVRLACDQNLWQTSPADKAIFSSNFNALLFQDPRTHSMSQAPRNSRITRIPQNSGGRPEHPLPSARSADVFLDSWTEYLIRGSFSLPMKDPRSLLWRWTAMLGWLLIAFAGHGAIPVSPAQHFSATGTGESTAPIISADGRWVVFVSTAPDLVTHVPAANFGSGYRQLFVRDLQTGLTELISVNASGWPGNGSSDQAAVSAEGRYVAFVSHASNLVAADTNGFADLFLWDRATRAIRLISQASDGANAQGESAFPVFSRNGRYLGFETLAGNLVTGDTNGLWDVMVYDVEQLRHYRLSAPSRAPSLMNRASGDSRHLAISDDGQTFAFASSALNLAPGLVSGSFSHTHGLYVRRGLEGTNRMVGIFGAGLSAQVTVTPLAFQLSGNGQSITCLASSSLPNVFPSGFYWVNLETGEVQSLPANLPRVPSPRFIDQMGPCLTTEGSMVYYEGQSSGASWDPSQTVVLAWSAATRTAEVVSILTTNVVSTIHTNVLSHLLAASDDGAYLALLGEAPETATAGDGRQQILVLHRPSSSWRRITRGQTGLPAADHSGASAVFSADGRKLAFPSTASHLVESDRNNASDVFVYDWEADEIQLVSGRATPNVPTVTGPGRASMHRGGLSRDGTRLAFTSSNAQLVARDTNAVTDVFVQDIKQGTLALVSVALEGSIPANGLSHEAVISADGRWVAFNSLASNLVPNDTNGMEDVFLRDLAEGRTVRASREPGSVPPLGDGARQISISPDGRYVAFTGRSAGATGTSTDIFLYDHQQDTVSLVTRDPMRPMGGNGESGNPTISPDGRWLYFESRANNLGVSGPLNAFSSYRFPFAGGAVELLSPKTGSGGRAMTLPSSAAGFSPEGTSLAFARWSSSQRDLLLHEFAPGTSKLIATNAAQGALSGNAQRLAYVTAPRDGVPQVRVLDLTTGTDQLVSVGIGGEPGDAASTVALITPDGRFVVFGSRAGNLVAGDMNRLGDVFLRDLTRQTTLMLSAAPGNAPTARWSGMPVLSADGTAVAFTSFASELVDAEGNQQADIFVAQLPSTESSYRIASITRLGDREVILTWATEPNRLDRLQATTDLTGFWSDLPLAIQINGHQATAVDALPVESGQRFYRLVIAP